MGTITLTTDHPASSYGVPVALIDGEAYGPSDILRHGEFASVFIGRWSLLPERTSDELDMVRRFLAPAGGLVSRGDIAKAAGVSVDTVTSWITRHPKSRPDFPIPAARTAGGDIWWWVEVRDWLRKTGRLP